MGELDLTVRASREDLVLSLKHVRQATQDLREFSRIIAQDPSVLLRGKDYGLMRRMPRPTSLLAACCRPASAGRRLPRSYYVMASEPLDYRHHAPAMRGLLYVRNLDVDAVYEKFQIVVRNSPYELRYAEQNVWAVKPTPGAVRLARAGARAHEHLRGRSRASSSLSRPQFTLSGQLNAAEIYDSGDDLWFAHLSVSLSLVALLGRRTACGTTSSTSGRSSARRTFAHGVRGLSELTHTVIADVGEADRPELGGVKAPEEPPPSLAVRPAAARRCRRSRCSCPRKIGRRRRPKSENRRSSALLVFVAACAPTGTSSYASFDDVRVRATTRERTVWSERARS